MKNTYYTIFDRNHILPFIECAHDIAHESVIGRRNQLEAVPCILDVVLNGGFHSVVGQCANMGESIPHISDKIKRGDIIYRFNGCNLGTNRFPDYRQILDIVIVDHISQKFIIGANCERVRPEQIICVCREGIERSTEK